MADEENKQDEESPEETSEAPETEAPPAEEAAPAADADAPADDASDDEVADAADEKPTPGDAGSEAEDVSGEVLTPKQRRKLERSQNTGEARPTRSPEERASERVQRRAKAAAERRRYRAKQRQARGEAGQGTPPAEREPGAKKVRQGRVVSAKADKTITVRIDVARRHPQYEKVVRRSATLHAHDAGNEASEGDTVRVVETRPLSRTKRWRLVEVVEKAR
jgi:small subunit ribosomal protein S17